METGPTPPAPPEPTIVSAPAITADSLGDILAPATPTPPPPISSPIPRPPHRHPWRALGLTALGLVLVLVGLTATTEAGYLHIGFDRLYSHTSLPFLWGSLPADPTTVLAGLKRLPTTQGNSNTGGDLTLSFKGSAVDPTNTGEGGLSLTYSSFNRGAQRQLNLQASLASRQYSIPHLQTVLTKNGDDLYLAVPLATDLGPQLASLVPAAYYGRTIHYTLPSGAAATGTNLVTANLDQLQLGLQQLAGHLTRVGIERLNNAPTSHWRLSLTKEDLLNLHDNYVTESLAEVQSLNLVLDFWVRHGDYQLVKVTVAAQGVAASGQGSVTATIENTGPQVPSISLPDLSTVVEFTR